VEKKKLIVGAAAAVGVLALSTGAAVAVGEDDKPLRGSTWPLSPRTL
jgi:hypothetical protein